ncbi:MAG: DUF1275 domain-containing protein [Lachnospiraceae bacterium]|nr:DUF1275 domain-containing protein [Lachnospiraceae bacterium]
MTKTSFPDIVVGAKRLRVAVLLSIAGGFLDAYTYFVRGGVFSNAQTGNIVMLGIAVVSGEHENDEKYLLSIAAFLSGIITVLIVEKGLQERKIPFVRRAVLLIESLTLFFVGFLPRTANANLLANVFVSFVAAMQMEAFKTFRGEPIATTVSTGNLRKFAENLYTGTMEHNPGKIKIASFYLMVILSFVAGACFGAFLSMKIAERAIFAVVVVLLIACGVITLIKKTDPV